MVTPHRPNLVFLAKTSNPGEWKVVATTIQTLVEEASFAATAEGLTFRAMDPSHVALVDMVWPNSAFEKYECDKEFKFSVRVEDLVRLIRRAEAKDSIEIASSDDDTLLLRMSNGYKREFKLHLIESASGPTPLPKLGFNSKAHLIEGTFEKILNDVSTISDHITIRSLKDKIEFTGKSDKGTASATVDKKSDDVLELEVKEESDATYSIEYMSNIVKAAGSGSDTLTFEYSSKMPLKIEFKLGDAGGKIDFYLAPRIEDK